MLKPGSVPIASVKEYPRDPGRIAEAIAPVATVNFPRGWEPAVSEPLIDGGYIEFLPQDYRLQTDIRPGNRKGINRERLKTKTQLSCVQEWLGLSPKLWEEQSFRVLIRTRHAAGDRKTLELLPIRVSRILGKVAKELIRKRASPNFLLFDGKLHFALKKRGLGDMHWKDSCLHLLINEYVRSIMKKNLKDHPWLNARLSQGGLFKAVSEREIHFSSSKREMLESPRLWTYLQADDGTLDAIMGQLVRDLIEVEDWTRRRQAPDLPVRLLKALRAWRSVNQMILNEDYLKVASRYSKKLKIPLSCFRKIHMAFVVLSINEVQGKWSVTNQSVFLAAVLLRHRHPSLFRRYRTMLRGVKRQVVKWDTTPNQTVLNPIHEAERRALRSMLDADPLLRIVFHFDVLQGRDLVNPKNPRGMPSKPAKRHTAAVADKILNQFMDVISSRKVESMFGRVEKKRRASILEGVRGNSYYQHVASLLNLLFHDFGGKKFTPQQIKKATQAFGELDRVKSLAEDPSEEFVAAVGN